MSNIKLGNKLEKLQNIPEFKKYITNLNNNCTITQIRISKNTIIVFYDK